MLELYQAEDCPYSQDVRETMTDLGLSYVAHNPRTHEGELKNETTREAMEAIGGEDQIPFLVDTECGETIYESDEIVEHLEEYHS
ncbi:glutathione S-transferase N-terminal domain-containing protein [Halalkalicoccus salilacus]|uniref:glutathione S-transferase N-terminal domain-containing protein n=1 Tax=Halalkalicoccus TaxID=332246 RepID=UPI002F962759